MTRSERETTLNLTGSAGRGNRIARAAGAIHTAHEHWIRGFEEITRRARERFERRDWRGAQADATARLALYRIHLDAAVADVRDILEDAVLERTLWATVKARHGEGLVGRLDAEVAQTFFNSVTRRIFSTVGADPAIEYLDPAVPPGDTADPTLLERYVVPEVNPAVVRTILQAYPWLVPYAQLERDAGKVASIVQDTLAKSPDEGP